MTVLYGSIAGDAEGHRFRGVFGPKGGPPEFAIQGELSVPIENLRVPNAELVNGKSGRYRYRGLIGPEFFNIRTETLPEVIVLGKLSNLVRPTPEIGWLQIIPLNE